jgi:DNA polymerase family A
MHCPGFSKGVWAVDYEFHCPPGEIPRPICLVAREINTGRLIRRWLWHEKIEPYPPYPIDAASLMVTYYGSAELGCHEALGWKFPANHLDLFIEYRNLYNGLTPPAGWGLLGAMSTFGLDSLSATEKEEMRQLAMCGGPFTDTERRGLLDYCQSDVDALSRLLPKMEPMIDFPRALLRGRYMGAAACMEHVGVPIDVATFNRLKEHWPAIQERIIEPIDRNYGVYEGTTFKYDRFQNWLVQHNLSWPMLDTGRLALDADTFHEMARIYPHVAPLSELRYTLGEMRVADLDVGSDGRNRRLLSAFRARTGRNQPSSTHFIFGPSTWLRHLIRPEPGWGCAYVDWEQQEWAIAAVLSGDKAMLAAYETGDPYLTFAKQAKAVPPEGDKKTYKAVRDKFKACALAVNYGMGATSLADRINQPTPYARSLLKLHKSVYPKFWEWSDAVVSYAMLHGKLCTNFGWQIWVGQEANPRSLRNFPVQGNGSEMLRLACCMATEAGIRVCAPVHDAVLIEAPIDQLDEQIASMQEMMRKAGAAVLDGFELRTDVKKVCYPDRYSDERGEVLWQAVKGALEDITCSIVD